MSDTTTTTAAICDVYAPDGMAWVNGHEEWPGHWETIEDVRSWARADEHVRYAEESPHSDAKVVQLAADEPASLADLMHLAADVERLTAKVERMREGVESTLALIDALLARGVAEVIDMALQRPHVIHGRAVDVTGRRLNGALGVSPSERLL